MDGKYELVLIIVQTQGWCNLLSPRFFLKKAKGVLLSPQSARLSVRPLCYLLLNHWTKFSQIWYVSYSHAWGVQRQTFLAPVPWGGVKMSNIIKFQLQSQFQRFVHQTLYVLTQMKDTKHIRRDFHSVAGSCPRGGTLGCWRCPGGQKFIFSNMVMFISNRREWRAERNAGNIFILGSNW